MNQFNYRELIKKYNEALDFLDCHPATSTGTPFEFNSLLWYSVQEVCSRGYSMYNKDETLSIHYNEENYKRYKKEFDRELKHYKKDDITRNLCTVDIPYERHFGEKWKFDHIEWWGEMSFVLFKGKDFINNYFKVEEWERYQGIECSGKSFEQLIINTANKFKEAFGDVSEDAFLSKEEKQNHKKFRPFYFVKLKDKKYKGCSEMKTNEKYMHINSAMLNLRWKEVFLNSDYCKKNYKWLIDENKK
jgi:hypothetical protein